MRDIAKTVMEQKWRASREKSANVKNILYNVKWPRLITWREESYNCSFSRRLWKVDSNRRAFQRILRFVDVYILQRIKKKKAPQRQTWTFLFKYFISLKNHGRRPRAGNPWVRIPTLRTNVRGFLLLFRQHPRPLRSPLISSGWVWMKGFMLKWGTSES